MRRNKYVPQFHRPRKTEDSGVRFRLEIHISHTLIQVVLTSLIAISTTLANPLIAILVESLFKSLLG